MPETDTRGDDPDPVPVEDSVEDQLDVFVERFRALQDEALQLGFDSIVGLCCHDHLSQQSYRAIIRRGNWFAARGLLMTMMEEVGEE